MLLLTMMGVLLLCYVVSWRRAPRRTRTALARSRFHLASMASPLLAILLAMGLLRAWLPQGPPASLLQRFHGAAAVLGAAVVGAFSSGGPVVSYPIAGALFQHGAGLPAGVTAALLTAWTSVSGFGLPVEAAALGRRFAVVRNAVALLGACAVGAAVGLLYGIGQ